MVLRNRSLFCSAVLTASRGGMGIHQALRRCQPLARFIEQLRGAGWVAFKLAELGPAHGQLNLGAVDIGRGWRAGRFCLLRR
ncbi:hypothetical protein D3C81_1952120 [compost metagenome]